MSSAFAANIDWLATSSVSGESSSHFLTFTSATGNSQTVTFSGNARDTGNHQILLTAYEPGAEIPMDTVTVVLRTEDSNAPVTVYDSEESSAFTELAENPMVQAALGALVLFVLMGALMIRGHSRNVRSDAMRVARAEELRQSRGISNRSPSRSMIGQQNAPPTVRKRSVNSSLFDDLRRKK
jgi:hypothetical protein